MGALMNNTLKAWARWGPTHCLSQKLFEPINHTSSWPTGSSVEAEHDRNLFGESSPVLLPVGYRILAARCF